MKRLIDKIAMYTVFALFSPCIFIGAVITLMIGSGLAGRDWIGEVAERWNQEL